MHPYCNAHHFGLFWNYLPNTDTSGIDQWFTATLGQCIWNLHIPRKFGMYETPCAMGISHWRDCWEATSSTLCGMCIPKWKNCQMWPDPHHLLQDRNPTIGRELHRGSSNDPEQLLLQGHPWNTETVLTSPKSPTYRPAPVPWWGTHLFEVSSYLERVSVCGEMIPIRYHGLLLARRETGSWGKKVRVWGTRYSRFFCL